MASKKQLSMLAVSPVGEGMVTGWVNTAMVRLPIELGAVNPPAGSWAVQVVVGT